MINNKVQMYEMLEAGCFGNRFRIWNTEEDFKAAVDNGFNWLVGVRCVGQPGLPYYHHKTYEDAIVIGQKLKEKYGYPVRYYEASPDQFITVQGEFLECAHSPVLEWSTARTHMREALRLERNVLFGPGARLLLKRELSEGSYEDFMALGELYPDAVIEFTAYEIFVGNIPGRNAVIWEVRNY
jgi:hypothetical protein